MQLDKGGHLFEMNLMIVKHRKAINPPERDKIISV